jgi:hypothetical protein
VHRTFDQRSRLPQIDIIEIFIGAFGGETAYLLREYGFHYDIDEKWHVCLNDVVSSRRQFDGI